MTEEELDDARNCGVNKLKVRYLKDRPGKKEWTLRMNKPLKLRAGEHWVSRLIPLERN